MSWSYSQDQRLSEGMERHESNRPRKVRISRRRPSCSPGSVAWVEDIQHALVAQSRALRDHSGLVQTEDAREIVGGLQQAVRVIKGAGTLLTC